VDVVATIDVLFHSAQGEAVQLKDAVSEVVAVHVFVVIIVIEWSAGAPEFVGLTVPQATEVVVAVSVVVVATVTVDTNVVEANVSAQSVTMEGPIVVVSVHVILEVASVVSGGSERGLVLDDACAVLLAAPLT